MVDSTTAEPLPLPVLLLMPTKHMGNLLVSLASIAALAQAARGRSLVIVDQSYRDIVDTLPDLGPILYFPRKALTTGSIGERVGAAWRFIRALRRFKGKLVIDFDGQRASGWICRLASIPERVGPASAKDPGAYSRLFPAQGLHLHRYCDYAAYCRTYLGTAPAPSYPLLAPPPERETRTRAHLSDLGIEENIPLVSMHVGATKDYKQWPARYFAELCDWLTAQGCQVALIGAGKRDGERIAQVLSQARRQPINLHNRLALGELLVLFRASQFFIGNDSGPMHLAAAAGIPVFGLFGPTDQTRWAPLGGNATVIRSATPCGANCWRTRCTENYRCMTTLSPQAVKARLIDSLPTRPATGAAAEYRHGAPLLNLLVEINGSSSGATVAESQD